MLSYPRTSRIFYGITSSGVLQPLSVSKVRGVSPSDFPHLMRGAERLLDLPVKPSWSTVRRKKTTTGGFTVKETGYRPKKWGGLGSPYERRKIAKIREDNELKRRLLAAGINEHQLFLLLHSAIHSQTLLERNAPIRSLPSYKRGGFRSSKEIKEMKKQRRRNQRLASRGTIYHY